MNEKLDIMLELIRETKNSQDRLCDDIREIRECQIRQGEQIERNRISLDEHMEQTRLVRQQNELIKQQMDDHKGICDTRFDKIEEPIKAKQLIYSWILKLGALAGVAVGLYEAAKMFKII